jgi:teichuronic acid exporter
MTRSKLHLAALSGARWTVASRVGLQLLTWPITLIVMRLLEPSDYGLFALAMITTGFVALFSELGLGVALVQARQVDARVERAACAAILALNSIVALVLVLLAPWAADWFNEPELDPVMKVLTLELLVSSFAVVPQALLERQLKFRQLSIALMISGASGSVATLAAAWLGLGVWSFVIGTLTLAAVRSAALIGFHGRIVWPSFRAGFGSIRSMQRFSSHVVASRTLWYWYGQSDQVILGRVLHASMLGFYSVAAQLAALPASKIMEAVNRVALPILARLRDDATELRSTHERLVRLVATYGFALCWGLAAVAPEFVLVVLGEKWRLSIVPLALLSLVAPLRMLCALHNTISTAAGSPQAATKELAFASVLIPSALLAGTWWGGLQGAAVAWVVAFPLVYLVSNALTCAALGSKAWNGLRPLAAPLAAALVMVGGIWLVRHQLAGAHAPLLLLVVELIAGALCYALTLRILAPALVREVLSLVSDLLHPSRASS